MVCIIGALPFLSTRLYGVTHQKRATFKIKTFYFINSYGDLMPGTMSGDLMPGIICGDLMPGKMSGDLMPGKCLVT
jgi:hypothetical protein